MTACHRKTDFIRANRVATHAYQIAMFRKHGRGDPSCWAADGVSDAELQRLVAHQQALLAESPEVVRAWVDGGSGRFDPARDLRPLVTSSVRPAAANLPVNVLEAYFARQPGVTALQAQALATILQMILEVARDADGLQNLFAHSVHLGLPVHTAQLGISARTDEELLALAQTLAPQFAAAPFATGAVTLRMMFRKMWIWGHRYTGERDRQTLARELLQEPEVQALLPRLRVLPAQKIAVIGHSFVSDVHWSSPSAFVLVAAELLAHLNPGIEVRQWQSGGMNPARADCQRFAQEARAWNPARVLLVLANLCADDSPALEKMVADFAAQGVDVAMFDTIYGRLHVTEEYYWEPELLRTIACKSPIILISSGVVIDGASDRNQFVALDGVHMTEPYHRLMAKVWLRFLADAGKKARPRKGNL